MSQLATVVSDVTAAAFVVLGIATAYRWYRTRGRAPGWLAAALLSLAFVAGAGRFLTGHVPSLLLSALSIAAFLASGYFVLLFRGEFIPLSRRAQIAAGALLAGSFVVGVVDVATASGPPRPFMTLLSFELIVAWAILVGEPIVRFWLASNRLPAVQRARLRFLSFGFGMIIAILLVDVAGGAALRSSWAIVVTQLLALVSVPLIYFSFAPPNLLRRLWRMGEEVAMRAAWHDLLIFSPTRQVLAERAAGWATRVVGAEAAFVVDADGSLLAFSGLDRAAAEAMLPLGEIESSIERPAPGRNARVIAVPLSLTAGAGALAVVAGPFTPVFGSEEINQLRAYAGAVTAGLERAQVTERMAAIERNKAQFLNLASHELRGPVTVIRGYLSMLEGGLLGELNERGVKAADVMNAKVKEMNELIEQMIDAARLEDGALIVKPVEADLRDIARTAVESARPQLGPRHELVFDPGDRRVRVRADVERTQTIIANLISNAVKYSPDGGTVECEVRARAGVARVAVKDEGVGIASEDMPTLFTRFGRIVTPRTEHLQGTGLGLYLARQLARLQGGDITVQSTPGRGSVFALQMPVLARDGAAATGAELENLNGGTAPTPADGGHGAGAGAGRTAG